MKIAVNDSKGRGVGARGPWGPWTLSNFGIPINPTSSRGGGLCPLHCYLPTGFSDLPTALKGYVMDDCTLPGKLCSFLV